MDFVPVRREIKAPDGSGSAMSVTMHDGSVVRFRKTGDDYDPTDRDAAYAHVRRHQERGEVVTGLLYIDERTRDMHDINNTTQTPLVELPYGTLCPGNAALQELQADFR